MKNTNTKVSNLKKINQIIRKAKKEAEGSRIHYKRINNFKNMRIHGYADVSVKTQDYKMRSIEGRILFQTKGGKVSPFLWKSH